MLVEVVREDKVIAATHVEGSFAQPALFTLDKASSQALVVNETARSTPTGRARSIVTLSARGRD